MYPEDRVLVGVINRRRDLRAARDEHWYRIPLARYARPLDVEYIALFQSRAFGAHNGSIRWFADVRGVELVRRRDLLPDEPDHRRADAIYLRVALGDLMLKDPPVLNPTGRTITFILTTWDRFTAAKVVSDLYSGATHYVDRVYHALR